MEKQNCGQLSKQLKRSMLVSKSAPAPESESEPKPRCTCMAVRSTICGTVAADSNHIFSGVLLPGKLAPMGACTLDIISGVNRNGLSEIYWHHCPGWKGEPVSGPNFNEPIGWDLSDKNLDRCVGWYYTDQLYWWELYQYEA